jgi:hypothetical protein
MTETPCPWIALFSACPTAIKERIQAAKTRAPPSPACKLGFPRGRQEWERAGGRRSAWRRRPYLPRAELSSGRPHAGARTLWHLVGGKHVADDGGDARQAGASAGYDADLRCHFFRAARKYVGSELTFS